MIDEIFVGDLVNNVGGSAFGSSRFIGTAQYEEEWKIYRDILDRTNVTKYTKWLDIKGNHGKKFVFLDKIFLMLMNRCVYGFRSRFIKKFLSVLILFIKNPIDLTFSNLSIYSHQGHDHQGSYEYTLKTKDKDTYSFIGVDMCPRPGLGAPFNFFGRLNQVNLKRSFVFSKEKIFLK
jgi:hypothetical protein